jgi:hypothetical protein
MESHRAARLVPGGVPAVRQALAVLAAQLWGDRSRTLVDEAGQRIDAIAADAGGDEPDVWVTWTFTDRPEGTWVEVRVDELAAGPPPLVEGLLDALASRVANAARRAGRPG